MVGVLGSRAGNDYPETPRLKAARIALLSVDPSDQDIDTYRDEHRAALLEAKEIADAPVL